MQQQQNFALRLITPADAEAARNIYAPYVAQSSISFEYDVPAAEEWLHRIQRYSAEYPWLVCTCNNSIIGYAYGSRHRGRTAYNWSAESTVYMAQQYRGKGTGKVLYTTLFALLQLQGYVNVFAGVTQPNEASEAFHTAMGFYDVGVFKNIGYKFGQWHNTRWFGMQLGPLPVATQKILSVSELQQLPQFAQALAKGNAALNNINDE